MWSVWIVRPHAADDIWIEVKPRFAEESEARAQAKLLLLTLDKVEAYIQYTGVPLATRVY